MNILLATYYLREWSGSELYTADLARALVARGHQVHLHSPLPGALAQELEGEGFAVTRRLSELIGSSFDVAHVHHNVVAAAVRATFPTLPMVMLLHGVVPELEQPPSTDLGIAKLICVSEEVRQHAEDRGVPPDSIEVIRNFLDAEHWRATEPPRRELSRVLILSNRYSPEMQTLVESACASIAVETEHVGLPENPQRDTRPHISAADLVVTLGRGALEAMAMGRNVIVLGPQGADGLVDEESFFEFRRCNFSGRTRRIDLTPEGLAAEMQRYDRERGLPLRELVMTHNETQDAVSRLLDVYQAAAESRTHVNTSHALLPELSFLYEDLCTRTGRLEPALEATSAELANVYASRSWRWTAALRRMLTMLSGGGRTR